MKIVSKRTVACALAAALFLAAAAPAAAAPAPAGKRSRQTGRQAAGEPTLSGGAGGATGVVATVWRTIQALWGEEGGMIDPDGAPRSTRLVFGTATDLGFTDVEVVSPGA